LRENKERRKTASATTGIGIVAIAEANHSFADIKHLKDLGKGFLAELEDFFVNYHQLSGKKYHVIDGKRSEPGRQTH